jgi:Signal recognition particle 14kD protein
MKSAEKDLDDRQYPCLLRVTNGKETKFSTKVRFLRLPSLRVEYAVLRLSQINWPPFTRRTAHYSNPP